MSTTATFSNAQTTNLVDQISPVLASSLVSDGDLNSIFSRVVSLNSNINSRENDTEYLATGVKSLDTGALAGGLEPGSVVEIAGEGGGVGEIYKALLVNFLLRSNGQAAVVDTTGNFDVLGLYGILVAKLGKKDQDEEKAAKMLERVKIMRVFDFEGVREAVGEIEGTAKEEQEDVKRVEKPKRTYVADSEDEEEEMLFESETAVEEHQSTEGTPSTLKFILIDNLAQVVGPLLKNDLTQATFQTTTLLSTLTNLTHTHALHTILITPTTTTTTTTTQARPTSPTTRSVPISIPPHDSDRDRDIPPSPSIFSSNKSTSLPALSALMGLHADVRLMVSRIPRRRGDAKLYYSDESGVGITRRRGEVVCVVEVIGDRFGGRAGGWGVFE